MTSEHGTFSQEALNTMYLLALRCYQSQAYEQSRQLLEFILRHEPAQAAFHAAMGKALHALGRHERALGAYLRAVRLGLPDADVHFHIGQCLIFLHRHQAACEALQHSLQLARLQPARHAELIAQAQQLLAVALVQSRKRYVRLTDRLDASNAETRQQELLGLLEGQVHSLNINLAELDYLSSAGLRVLVIVTKASRVRGGRVVLAAPKPAILKTLKTSGFDQFLEIHA